MGAVVIIAGVGGGATLEFRKGVEGARPRPLSGIAGSETFLKRSKLNRVLNFAWNPAGISGTGSCAIGELGRR